MNFDYNLSKYIAENIIQFLTDDEKMYLIDIFKRFNGYPNLEQMWQLIDEQWILHKCDPDDMDEKVISFYRHPVWMLNGLFIEQHDESLLSRQVFTDWVVRQQPNRVADFGGGFGGLARLIGEALPKTQVEVIEPHPHRCAIALADSTPNVRFMEKLEDKYDIIIATDVFEHVLDPLSLASKTASHLHAGTGLYLIANCFQPVILCHLPQLFYFRIGWKASMQALGLLPGDEVSYGQAYKRSKALDLPAAQKVAACARRIYPWIKWMPRGHAKIGEPLMRIICR